MFDYLRVSGAVNNCTVGNTTNNTKEILKYINQAEENKSDIVVFPELAITGYSCADLFFQNTLLNNALKCLDEIVAYSNNVNPVIVVGLPISVNNQLFNCAAVIHKGRLNGLSVKTYIPNYSEFYEERWFSSANELTVNEIDYHGYKVKIGNNIIYDLNGYKFGVEICEDLWAPLPVSTTLALNGAEVILNLSASNETIAKRSYRSQLVTHQSASTYCGYVYVSAGRKESTQDLIFSGHSLIAENGSLLKENQNSIDTDYMISADIDVGKIRAYRLRSTTYSSCIKNNKSDMALVNIENHTINADGTLAEVYKLPFVPANSKDRYKRCMDIFEMQVNGLKKRLETINTNAVIGVSGGLDSTLALLVTVEAMKQLNRSSKDVYGVTMPCYGTSDRTYNNSVTLMEKLGVSLKEVNIAKAVDLHFSDIGHDKSILNGTYENSQARERTQVLMDYASVVNGIVIGTGDLSELALGWCTYNGDQMSMYGVNASIPKTLIRWMIEAISESEAFKDCKEVLQDILDTPISPELLPPDAKGKIAQHTEDIVGPYALHDFFLYYMLRFGFEPDKINYLANRAFASDFDTETITKWEKTFYKRFFTQQFKRSCMPDGVKVGSICLSPRGDWRMPSDASYGIWLEKLENL